MIVRLQPLILAILCLAEPAAAQRLLFNGFSIDKPIGADWRTVRRQSDGVVLGRRHESNRDLSTVLFARSIRPREPIKARADLKRFANRLKRSDIDTFTQITRISGALCALAPFKRIDKKSRKPSGIEYTIIGAELLCIHPKKTGMLVHLGHEFRYPSDRPQRQLLGPQIFFFNSVRFD